MNHRLMRGECRNLLCRVELLPWINVEVVKRRSLENEKLLVFREWSDIIYYRSNVVGGVEMGAVDF